MAAITTVNRMTSVSPYVYAAIVVSKLKDSVICPKLFCLGMEAKAGWMKRNQEKKGAEIRRQRPLNVTLSVLTPMLRMSESSIQ